MWLFSPIYRESVSNLRASVQCSLPVPQKARDPHRFLSNSLMSIAFVLGVVLLIPESVLAATYYVDGTRGDDANSGKTEAAAVRTIAEGSSRMSSGDTLLIRAGTYDETMVHGQSGFTFVNGTENSLTKYAAYPGEEGMVIIKPTTAYYTVWFSRTNAFIEFSGFVVDGTNGVYVLRTDGSFTYMDPSTSDGYSHGRGIRIVNNEIKNSGLGPTGDPASCVLFAGDNEFIDNHVHNCGSYGIYAYWDSGLIDGNVIHDTGRYGLHLYKDNYDPNNWIIRNNIFYDNGIRGTYKQTTGLQHSPAVLISRGLNNQFYNNLVYGSWNGVRVWSNADDTLIANNTIYGNLGYGIKVDSPNVDRARIVNNLVWGNGEAQIVDEGTNTVMEANLESDPLVTNAGGADFRLLSTSPARDAGVAVAGVTTDFFGTPRPQGGRYDIGAHEFVAPCQPGTAGCGTQPGGLFAHYKLNEGSGTVARDETDAQNDGTVGDGIAWVDGYQGTALRFPGDETFRQLELPFGTGGIDPTLQSLATCAIVTPDTAHNQKVVFSSGSNGSSQRLYFGWARSGNELQWGIGVQGSGFSSGSEFPVSAQPSFVCMVLNASTNTATLWVNGVKGTAAGASIKDFTSYTTTGSNLRYGNDGTYPVNSGGFDLDEVFFWNTAPSDTEIQELHETLAPTIICADSDGDGYGNPSDGCRFSQTDCDDNDPRRNPGAADICGDEVDQDCDGSDALCDAPPPASCAEVNTCVDNDGCCPQNCVGSDNDCAVTGAVTCTDDGQGGKICSVTNIEGCNATNSGDPLAWIAAMGLGLSTLRLRRRRHC